MPFCMALATGLVNAVELMAARAMPAAPAATAVSKLETIWEMIEFSEPPQTGVGSPSSEAASAIPYWVGVKNAFVVTWLTKKNFHAGVFGKLPAAAAAVDVDPPVLVLLLDEVHAARRAEAAAVALTRPVPASSLRRDGPSFMLS